MKEKWKKIREKFWIYIWVFRDCAYLLLKNPFFNDSKVKKFRWSVKSSEAMLKQLNIFAYFLSDKFLFNILLTLSSQILIKWRRLSIYIFNFYQAFKPPWININTEKKSCQLTTFFAYLKAYNLNRGVFRTSEIYWFPGVFKNLKRKLFNAVLI